MADNTFDWGNFLGAGLGALGNYYAGNQYGNATDSATKMADPFGPYRGQYAAGLNSLQSQPFQQRVSGYASGPANTNLNNLLQNPSSVSQQPGYQFGMDQGTQAIQRSQASKGLLNSGATGKELTRFGQGYAGQQFNNYRDYLTGQANQETSRNQSAFQNEQSFLGQAAGANFNPSTAAALALAGRGAQQGAYNQGLGNLLGSTGYGQNGGLTGSLLGNGQNGSFQNSPVGQIFNQILKQFGGGSPSGVGVPGQTAGNNMGYTNATDAGLYDGSGGAADYQGGTQSYPYTSAWDMGSQGYQLPADSYGGSYGAGDQALQYGGDMGSDISGGIDWSSFGSGTGNAAASTGTASAAGAEGGSTAAGSGAAAGASSMASAIPIVGMMYAIGKFLSGRDETLDNQSIQGGYNTLGRLQQQGVNPADITAQNLFTSTSRTSDPQAQHYIDMLKSGNMTDAQGTWTSQDLLNQLQAYTTPTIGMNPAFETQHPGALSQAGINGFGTDISNLTQVIPGYQDWINAQLSPGQDWYNQLLSQYSAPQGYYSGGDYFDPSIPGGHD